MLAEMDRCAATTVRRFLYDSTTGARHALTVGVDKMIFHRGAEIGNLIFLTGTVIKTGNKAIVVMVVAEREETKLEFPCCNARTKNDCRCIASKPTWAITREKMAEGQFTFCAYDMEQKRSMPHGIKL